ncbi:MAG: AMP-dependent synthetase and ligase [Candidatus Angelobacter sp.]|jgi:long-chain acyl-CoA synthetase|nr:AMP-dependent synthetase and ligase [Candidatus Angelobacter sp.]
MLRTKLHADPTGIFLHDAVLSACNRFSKMTALVDTSCIGPARRVSYAEFAELVGITAKNLVAVGIRPGEVVAIYMPNGWEYAVSYHAITLAGAVPTLLNPSYREREARYQLENSGAVALITDGPQIAEVNLGGLPKLRHVFTTRHAAPGARHFSELQRPSSATIPSPAASPASTLGALPFSSGTTGLPKGVMLTHHNLLANAYQTLAPGEKATPDENDVALCFLPLYHIYGLNVILNPFLLVGASIVLMARFDMERALGLFVSEEISYLPLVPPVMNGLCVAAEQGHFPKNHCIRTAKSGAAPLAPELPNRFTNLTRIPVRQGYGMTEASPVTHLGFLEPHLYRPDSIGPAVAQTDCRLVDEAGNDVPVGEPGELVMRGPQFMQGYFNAPEATREVLRDGWYWSGDIAVRDDAGFYKIVDRRKEMIKCKGFPVAPAEVEAVLLEHPAVRDCGVIGKPDDCAGEVPYAFIVLRESIAPSAKLESELCGYVGERLCSFKQPRSVRFVDAIPRNPSGKILRKDLRTQL